MPVIRTADAVVHDRHGARFVSYASSASGSTELCVWRTEVGPRSEGVEHGITKEEVFVVIEGSLRITIDGAVDTLRAGDVAVAPAGSTLRVDNLGTSTASMWVSTTRGLEASLPDGSVIAPPWAN